MNFMLTCTNYIIISFKKYTYNKTFNSMNEKNWKIKIGQEKTCMFIFK